jgi:chloramphenicol O-acetyltransferase
MALPTACFQLFTFCPPLAVPRLSVMALLPEGSLLRRFRNFRDVYCILGSSAQDPGGRDEERHSSCERTPHVLRCAFFEGGYENMDQHSTDFQEVPYPKYWRFAAAANRSVRHKPMIHGLLEVDVTMPRAILREYKSMTGETLSFTAFLIVCLAKAVDEHKAVQAIRWGGARLILFDDVDVCTRIERNVAGQKYVVPYIVRAANYKSFRQLHDEIRTAQRVDAQSLLKRFQMFSLLPTALYKSFVSGFTRLGRWRPRLWKETMGTVGITSVGMFGAGAGWGIPASSPTALMLTVGGIGEKQVVVDGKSSIRECLSLTISVDHDLVDGAPAARFAQRLKELIESGYGLDLNNRVVATVQTPGPHEAPYASHP